MRRGLDNAYFVSISQVGVDHLRRAGMDLDVQTTTDFTTMLVAPAQDRRTNFNNAALLSYPACGLAALSLSLAMLWVCLTGARLATSASDTAFCIVTSH